MVYDNTATITSSGPGRCEALATITSSDAVIIILSEARRVGRLLKAKER